MSSAIATKSIFSTVPNSNFLGLLDESKPIYKKIQKFLNFSKEDFSSATGVEKNSIRDDSKMPRELTDRLTEIASVCELVASYFDGDPAKTSLWFKLPNPMLGNISPRDMIRLGRYKKLIKFIHEAMQGL